MQHLDAIPGFRARRARLRRIGAERMMREREPRHGRDDARLDLAAREELAQARLHEDAVRRARRIRIERAERQDLHALGTRAGIGWTFWPVNCLSCAGFSRVARCRPSVARKGYSVC